MNYYNRPFFKIPSKGLGDLPSLFLNKVCFKAIYQRITLK
ncbi:hypothetical protein HMPREF9104_02554 [Lentilactobacillus kisonensis F0435]|uniref:Uncharacterized protein n=1 Tax=Lentilactobacillus kisonensis F0435 TaxID=797516 RepID=H1LIW2_9LACO|nr:hypothetical protein HMPREF9104_02554 [Lentilactobacillus kisonensis F0435]